MSKGGRYLNTNSVKPKKKAKKGKKIFLIVLSVILVLLLVAAGAGIWIYNSMLDRLTSAEVVDKEYTMSQELEQMMGVMETEETTEATEEAVTEATTKPAEVETTLPADAAEPDMLNVLVVGQSYREGEDSRLADTMILVTINKNTSEVTLTSFLRDTFLKMPDYKGHTCGKNRINVCYHLGWTWGDTGGAMEMINLCLKNNFGVEVDYNVEVDFDVFKKVIDVLGGVRIELSEAEAKYLNEHKADWQEEVSAGEHRLFGDYALSYARMRKAEGDADSDIKRTERQRKLITAIINKLKTKGVSVAQDLVDEVLPMITTNMTKAEITTCLLEVLPLLPDLTIESGTCPISGSYWGEVIDLFGVPSSVLKYDERQNREYMTALTEGTLK